MAYFLKKTNNKKGTYLQIYSSFYDPERRHTAHKAYKPIGYVHELQAKGIDDPISFYKEEVIRLNQEANAAKAEYNIYSKTATFFESGEIIVSGAGRRASDLVQYDDMALNYIIADAKGRWKQ